MTPDERTAWLASRRSGIGGSDIAAILGISPWQSSFGLWLDKTGRDTSEDKEDERQYWGKRVESVILDEWSDRHGKPLDRGRQVVHPTASIIRATLDGSTPDLSIVVEAKSVDATPREPQPYYACQVLWEMLASGADTGYLTELVRGNDLVEFVFTRAEHEARMGELATIGLEWWERHVIHDNPPDPLAVDVKRIQHLFPSVDEHASVDLPDDLVQQYLTAKAEEEEASMRKDAAQTKIQMQMGAAKHGKSGLGKVSWYSVAGRESADLKLLKKEHPDIAAKVIKTGAGYRVFKLT